MVVSFVSTAGHSVVEASVVRVSSFLDLLVSLLGLFFCAVILDSEADAVVYLEGFHASSSMWWS